MESVDFGDIAIRMTSLIQKNVVDPDLRTWIMPAFSTTTQSDRIVAAILMMGTLQKYFHYYATLLCGIPTVTLLGEREDWAMLLTKIEKLPQLGKEPAQFADLLRPVLKRFVASFDDPTSPEVLDFWAKCVHHEREGSGSTYLSGWVTAFCFWDEDGRSLNRFSSYRRNKCEFDGVLFHTVDIGRVPSSYASVPLTVDDNGSLHETIMVAGLVGIQATSNGSTLHGSIENNESNKEPRLDTIQPLSGWWMYEKEESEEEQA